jgi:hypothetical protein
MIDEITVQGKSYKVANDSDMELGNKEFISRKLKYKMYIFRKITTIRKIVYMIYMAGGIKKDIKLVSKNKYIKKYISEYPE